MKAVGLGCLGAIVGIVVLVVIVGVIFSLALSSNPETKGLLTGDVADVTVQVGGGTTDGFTGSIGSGATQRSVQGVSPATYTVSGDDSSGIIVAVFQSQGRAAPGNPLTVELIGCPDGEPHRQSTDADYGVVTVSC